MNKQTNIEYERDSDVTFTQRVLMSVANISSFFYSWTFGWFQKDTKTNGNNNSNNNNNNNNNNNINAYNNNNSIFGKGRASLSFSKAENSE